MLIVADGIDKLEWSFKASSSIFSVFHDHIDRLSLEKHHDFLSLCEKSKNRFFIFAACFSC